jgi:hypothetical protein
MTDGRLPGVAGSLSRKTFADCPSGKAAFAANDGTPNPRRHAPGVGSRRVCRSLPTKSRHTTCLVPRLQIEPRLHNAWPLNCRQCVAPRASDAQVCSGESPVARSEKPRSVATDGKRTRSEPWPALSGRSTYGSSSGAVASADLDKAWLTGFEIDEREDLAPL